MCGIITGFLKSFISVCQSVFVHLYVDQLTFGIRKTRYTNKDLCFT